MDLFIIYKIISILGIYFIIITFLQNAQNGFINYIYKKFHFGHFQKNVFIAYDQRE